MAREARLGYMSKAFIVALLLTSLGSFAALHASTRSLSELNNSLPVSPKRGPPPYDLNREKDRAVVDKERSAEKEEHTHAATQRFVERQRPKDEEEFNYNNSAPVRILMWDGGTPFGWSDGQSVPMPNYLGYPYEKRQCPVSCEFIKDREKLPSADAILFDPCLTGPDGFRDIPVYMPDKKAMQRWGWFTYEQYNYFPMMREMEYMSRFDYKMTYHHDAQAQITFACPWGGVSDLMKPVPEKDPKKIVAFLASNCWTGGADKRTAYVKELMNYIKVDSFGYCLHNTEYVRGPRVPHGNQMVEKIDMISQYKFLLAFENTDGVEDYVTEKLINAFQAGTVPVYYGAPTVDKWQIAPHSLIKTTDFNGPKQLAEYLLFLSENDDEYMKYFAWKKTGISPSFQRLWDSCYIYAECSLCKYIARSRDTYGHYQRSDQAYGGHCVQLNGLDVDTYGGDDYLDVDHHPALDLTTDFTLMGWIKLSIILDGRILDKNVAGDVNGYNMDVMLKRGSGGKGQLRLCAGGNCYYGHRELGLGIWYHVAATFETTGDKHSVRLYINGKLDAEHSAQTETKTNKLKLRFGRASVGGSSWRPHHAASVYDGYLDELSIWNRPLSEHEIYEYMFLRPIGNEAGLVAWWNFNEGSGWTAHDLGPHGLHATMIGRPKWVASVSKPVLDPSNIEGKHDL